MFIVYKGDQVVYRTQDFTDAFRYARKLSSEGHKSFITASSDRQLFPKPKKLSFDLWGDEDEKSL